MSDNSQQPAHDPLDDIETVRGIANSCILETSEADAIERVCDAATLHHDTLNAPVRKSAPSPFKASLNMVGWSVMGVEIIDRVTGKPVGTLMLSGSSLSPDERRKAGQQLADLIEQRSVQN